jgi:methylated-DNA-protein-cysteine methyltransferase-like protein
MPTQFSEDVIRVLKAIPRGSVATYGQVARLAGNPRAARQVVRLLNAYSSAEELPWHRVINKQGRISLKRGSGYELQKSLLVQEGIRFDKADNIDLSKYQWRPE